ncbi:hypothetical protein D3C80_1324310 [compost metagenome]
MLGATDHQHLLFTDVQAPAAQMPGYGGALMGTAAVGLIAQQGFQIARCRQLAQRAPQQLGLAGQGGVVEVQVQHARSDCVLVDAQPWRQRGLPDKGTAPGFATDQPHGLQLPIDPGRGGQCQAFAGRQFAVGGQARTRCQASGANVGGERVHQGLVAGAGHGVVSSTII